MAADKLVNQAYDPKKSTQDNFAALQTIIASYASTGGKAARESLGLSPKGEITEGTAEAYNTFTSLANNLMSEKIIGSKLTNDKKIIANFDAEIASASSEAEKSKLIQSKSRFISSEYQKAKILFGEVQEFYTSVALYTLGNSLSDRGANKEFKIGRSGGTNNWVASTLNKTISVQKQARHVKGTAGSGKGYLNSTAEAQTVLDAVRSGNATFLGVTQAGHLKYRFNGVTGTNVNLGAGITGQPTNVFLIKGTTAPSVVPTSPIIQP